MRAPGRPALAVLVGLAVLGSSRAEDAFPALLKYVPQQANAALFVDVQALKSSRWAAREQRNETKDGNYVGGLNHFPPAVTKLVAASQFAPTSLENDWEVGVLALDKDVTAAQVAQVEAGSLDPVGDTQLVLLRRNAYALVIDPRTVGVRRPANRQETARWARSLRGRSRAAVSPYLSEAAALAGKEAPVVMAMDLADVFDPAGVRKRLAACKTLAGSKADLDRLVRLIGGLRGFTLLVRADDALSGELRLDFAEDPAALAKLAKPLVLEALDGMAAHVDDLEGWQSQVRGNAVVLNGPLSETEARMLLSPLLRPSTPVQTQPPAQASAPEYDPRLVASLRYFHAVAKMLDDLKNMKASSFNNLAYWYSKQSKAIDDLPILDVDDELLEYGKVISETLRGLSTLAKGVSSQNKIIEMNVQEGVATLPSSSYFYRYGPGGGWGYNVPDQAIVNNYGQVYGLIAANTAAEGQLRSKTWENVDAATRDMRQKMTKKYKMEFK
jgi:hypothetical protein